MRRKRRDVEVADDDRVSARLSRLACDHTELVIAHRKRGLTPERPVLRGTAQNPDVFFQAREACNRYYFDCPAAVQQTMDAFAVLVARVTAHAPKGIVRMRAGVSGVYAIPIDRRATQSVFLVDPSTPHFDVSGLMSIGNQTSMLRLHGSSNAYVVDASLGDPMLRMATSSGDTEITRMTDLATGAPSWWDETKPRWSVNWSAKTRFLEAPTSLRLPADYAQDDLSSPGCDEKSLPTIQGP